MKNLILILFLFLGLNNYSQINVDSIGIYMFEMHNQMREDLGISKRYMSKYCKQASKNHLDYLLKYGFADAHNQTKVFVGNKILRTPNDRYNYYNRDSIKVVDLDYVKYVKPFSYDGEICTAQEMRIDVNDKNVNKIIAKTLLQNFIDSKLHNFHLIRNDFSINEKIVRGYFSVDYKMTNGFYNFHCVAVFDHSRKSGLEVSKDYNKGYCNLY